MPASDGFLDGGLLVYDVSRFTQPFVLCEADTGNHTQFLGSAKEHEGCAVSKQGAGLPSRLEIVAEIGETTGSHNFYVAAESCSSSERSQIFTISCKSNSVSECVQCCVVYICLLYPLQWTVQPPQQQQVN